MCEESPEDYEKKIKILEDQMEKILQYMISEDFNDRIINNLAKMYEEMNKKTGFVSKDELMFVYLNNIFDLMEIAIVNLPKSQSEEKLEELTDKAFEKIEKKIEEL